MTEGEPRRAKGGEGGRASERERTRTRRKESVCEVETLEEGLIESLLAS